MADRTSVKTVKSKVNFDTMNTLAWKINNNRKMAKTRTGHVHTVVLSVCLCTWVGGCFPLKYYGHTNGHLGPYKLGISVFLL